MGLDPNDKKAFKKYSLGMKQKLGIAQALMENPEVIILDEPTNALDKKSVENINSMIMKLKSENKLVIISNHNREELEQVCDEIYSIENGKIYNHTILRGEINDEKRTCKYIGIGGLFILVIVLFCFCYYRVNTQVPRQYKVDKYEKCEVIKFDDFEVTLNNFEKVEGKKVLLLMRTAITIY